MSDGWQPNGSCHFLEFCTSSVTTGSSLRRSNSSRCNCSNFRDLSFSNRNYSFHRWNDNNVLAITINSIRSHDYSFTNSGISGGTWFLTSPDSSNLVRSEPDIWDFYVRNSQNTKDLSVLTQTRGANSFRKTQTRRRTFIAHYLWFLHRDVCIPHSWIFIWLELDSSCTLYIYTEKKFDLTNSWKLRWYC